MPDPTETRELSIPTISEQKESLRTAMIARRDALSAVEVETASAAVQARLASFAAFETASCVLSYIEKGNELATRPIIAWALRDGKRVMVPLTLNPREVVWSAIDSLDHLQPGRFGVDEPVPEDRRIAAPPVNAVVLVPGLAFTETGHRLGFGGGYYDRFLETHDGASIGLAYDWQVVDFLPVASHDVPVGFIATPFAIFAS